MKKVLFIFAIILSFNMTIDAQKAIYVGIIQSPSYDIREDRSYIPAVGNLDNVVWLEIQYEKKLRAQRGVLGTDEMRHYWGKENEDHLVIIKAFDIDEIGSVYGVGIATNEFLANERALADAKKRLGSRNYSSHKTVLKKDYSFGFDPGEKKREKEMAVEKLKSEISKTVLVLITYMEDGDFRVARQCLTWKELPILSDIALEVSNLKKEYTNGTMGRLSNVKFHVGRLGQSCAFLNLCQKNEDENSYFNSYVGFGKDYNDALHDSIGKRNRLRLPRGTVVSPYEIHFFNGDRAGMVKSSDNSYTL